MNYIDVNSTKFYRTENTKTIFGEFVVINSIFFINPIIAIFILANFVTMKKNNREGYFYLFYFFISIYLGLINTTKIPESDLLNYKASFDLASSLTFVQYIFAYQKEIFFYFLTYIANKIFFGNFKFYVMLFTFLQYYLIFISLHKFWRNNDRGVLVFSVFIFAIFNRYFFSSAHLVRQILAGSIFIYFYINRVVEKNTFWWLIPVAILTHSSSAILFILSFIPRIGEKISIKNTIIIFSVVIGGFLFGKQIVNLFDSLTRGISFLNYPFQRFQSMDMMEHGWYTGESVGTLRYWYYVQLMPCVAFGYFFAKKNPPIFAVMNLTIAIFLVLEIFVFSGLLFMQMRTIYYLYIMVPFVYPICFVKNRLCNYKPLKLGGMFFILSWFAYRLVNGFTSGIMEFAPLIDLIIKPVPFFFIN